MCVLHRTTVPNQNEEDNPQIYPSVQQWPPLVLLRLFQTLALWSLFAVLSNIISLCSAEVPVDKLDNINIFGLYLVNEGNSWARCKMDDIQFDFNIPGNPVFCLICWKGPTYLPLLTHQRIYETVSIILIILVFRDMIFKKKIKDQLKVNLIFLWNNHKLSIYIFGFSRQLLCGVKVYLGDSRLRLMLTSRGYVKLQFNSIKVGYKWAAYIDKCFYMCWN